MKTTQRKGFRHIQSIFSAVIEVSGPAKTSDGIAFFHNSPPNQKNRRPDEDFLPDMCLFRGGTACWSNIVTFGDLRKTSSEKDLQENVAKITWSMANCMAADPRRRFVYAFSIENTDMRIWFCDRSQMIVSQPYNFILNHLPLVHFFLSIANAQDVHLGLDPTITPFEDTGRYDIVVRSDNGECKTYRTLELLASREPHALFGRGTRVWRAVRIQDGQEIGEPVALKDAWVDYYLAQEGAIFEQVRLADRPPEHHSAEDFLLTVDCHGDVVLKEGPPITLDHTVCFGESGAPLCMPASSREELVEMFGSMSSTSDPSLQTERKLPTSRCLVHYRIAFQEICTSLSDETSIPAIFKALARITLALKHLHVAGWVHRDMSDQNILVRDHVARLADLEYTKRIGVGRDLVLGTADFMACEIETQLYLFLPGLTPPTTPDDPQKRSSKPLSISTLVDEYEEGIQRELPAAPAIRYNPLHDLESLWWIAVYFIVKREVVDESDPETFGRVASIAQRNYAAQLFDAPTLRQVTFQDHCHFLQNTESLQPIIQPIAKRLNTLRCILISRYRATERDLENIGRDSAGEIHQEFYQMFQTIAEADYYKNLKVRPFTPLDAATNIQWRILDDSAQDHVQPQCPSSSKRQLSELNEDNSSSPQDPIYDLDAQRDVKRRRQVDEHPTHDLRPRSRPYLPRRAKSRRA
ncbi:hypothetical protein EIP86_007105 [Pleurotus ostreatoroseus]|nr:hypothetical protein EIP86_007105 [Pleurotus ostreatoroseus]